MDPAIIETAGANAWPALYQEDYDGWVLRFSNGYTKRANSIYPYRPSTLPLDTKLEICCSRYSDHNLPVIFRVTSISPEPELDNYLENQRYQRSSCTKVMACPINNPDRYTETRSAISSLSLYDWLSLFYSLSDFSTEYRATHHDILSNIEKQVVYLGLYSKSKSVACAMGVLDGDYFGLFSLYTAANYRNQGFGGEIAAALMNWASEKEAAYTYLQVQVDNSPAFHLYRKFDFKPVYEYWYRIQPEVSTP